MTLRIDICYIRASKSWWACYRDHAGDMVGESWTGPTREHVLDFRPPAPGPTLNVRSLNSLPFRYSELELPPGLADALLSINVFINRPLPGIILFSRDREMTEVELDGVRELIEGGGFTFV